VQSIISLYPGITITGAARTKEVNNAVGGRPNSAHLTGKALDIRSNDESKQMWENLSNASDEVLSQFGIDSIFIEKGSIPVNDWDKSDHIHVQFK